MLASASSPPPSPLQARFSPSRSPSRPRSMHIRLPDVSSIFKMRRRSSGGADTPTRKPQTTIESSSGEPMTHPDIQLSSPRKVPVGEEGRFVCRGGADAVKLLRAVRTSLYEKAEAIGANVLVDEQWTCSIVTRKDNNYRVVIRYSAAATRSSSPDPQKPVALENAKSVAGLMTILNREE